MLTVRKSCRFHAAHILTGHAGACRNLHGHTYRVTAEVAQAAGDTADMVIDFHDLKALLRETVAAPFDHAFLYDETSADMLDITFSGIVFDLGTIFDWGGMYSTVISQILSMGGSPAKTFDYVSKWESIKEKAESEIDKTIEIILAREF